MTLAPGSRHCQRRLRVEWASCDGRRMFVCGSYGASIRVLSRQSLKRQSLVKARGNGLGSLFLARSRNRGTSARLLQTRTGGFVAVLVPAAEQRRLAGRGNFVGGF